jgi:hypothetical protein
MKTEELLAGDADLSSHEGTETGSITLRDRQLPLIA